VENTRKRRLVAYWLLAGVFMIVIQTLLGGVTRLSGSGLSITEWNPIMGTVPPLSEQEWNKAFDAYKQIGQYKILNHHFTLSDFKFIFFWEWFHRLWARTLGVVFAIGFIYFLVKKYFDKEMVMPLIVLFFLGALQGVIGWLMVKTGLNTEDVHVNYIALSIHFISAMILACFTLWFALRLLIDEKNRVSNNRLNSFTSFIIGILLLQLVYGAFMAGLKAAPAASTWPKINGYWIPSGMLENSIFNNPLNVQFIHRGLGYILFIMVIVWFGIVLNKAKNNSASLLKTTCWLPFAFVVIQVLLGVLTVLNASNIVWGKFGEFEMLAELHQLIAMLLLLSLVVNLYIIKREERSTPALKGDGASVLN